MRETWRVASWSTVNSTAPGLALGEAATEAVSAEEVDALVTAAEDGSAALAAVVASEATFVLRLCSAETRLEAAKDLSLSSTCWLAWMATRPSMIALVSRPLAMPSKPIVIAEVLLAGCGGTRPAARPGGAGRRAAVRCGPAQPGAGKGS